MIFGKNTLLLNPIFGRAYLINNKYKNYFSIRSCFANYIQIIKNNIKYALSIILYAYPGIFFKTKYKTKTVNSIRKIERIILIDNILKKHFLTRISLLLWYPVNLIFSIFLVFKNGILIKNRYGHSIFTQTKGQIKSNILQGLPAHYYYAYELHQNNNSDLSDHYLHRHTLKNKGFYRRLRDSMSKFLNTSELLNDKYHFYRLCIENELPTAKVYAIARPEGVCWLECQSGQPPQSALFIKPLVGKGGKGAERWGFADGTYQRTGHAALDGHALTASLVERSYRCPLMIQECLANHSELAKLSSGALCTLRMYTAINEDDDIEHIFSLLRMPRNPMVDVDNLHAGGLAAGVDSKTGILSPATDMKFIRPTGWVHHHPETGAKIPGRQLPYWRNAIDIVLTAHRHLRDHVVIGWDVAITPDGPKLIEGNSAPGVDVAQKLDRPWANARLGEILVHHMERQGLSWL